MNAPDQITHDRAAVTYDSKVCAARNGGRVWIEGARLKRHAWLKGHAITVSFAPGTNMIVIYRATITPQLKVRHVAGTVTRPIIDIVGAKVAETLGPVGTPLHVWVSDQFITVTVVKEKS